MDITRDFPILPPNRRLLKSASGERDGRVARLCRIPGRVFGAAYQSAKPLVVRVIGTFESRDLPVSEKFTMEALWICL